jgi:hypothetical protein
VLLDDPVQIACSQTARPKLHYRSPDVGSVSRWRDFFFFGFARYRRPSGLSHADRRPHCWYRRAPVDHRTVESRRRAVMVGPPLSLSGPSFGIDVQVAGGVAQDVRATGVADEIEPLAT